MRIPTSPDLLPFKLSKKLLFLCKTGTFAYDFIKRCTYRLFLIVIHRKNFISEKTILLSTTIVVKT